MADEQVSVEFEMFPPQASDLEKKRKLVDMEADAPENGKDGDAMLDNNIEGNAEKEEETVSEEAGGEPKRPRLEKVTEEAGVDSVLKQTPLVKSENGSSENGYEDNGDKVVEALEEKVKEETEEEKVDSETESLQDNVSKNTDGEEQPQEPSAPEVVGELADGDLQVQQAADNEQPSGQDEQNIEKESGAAKLEDVEPSSDINPDGDGLTAEQKPVPEDQTTTRKIEVSNNKVGVLIGKGGDTIRNLQINSGAKIQIMRDSESDARATTRPVELIGTLECIERAEKLIKDVIAEADAGGSPALVAKGLNSVQSVVGEQVEMQVPNEKVGMIIGKGGETIKNLQTQSGARIQLVPQHLPSGDQSKERTVRITGDMKNIERARELITEVMNQNVRHSSNSGGYNQHSHRPRGHGPHWPHRNTHPSHDYEPRGPYQPQNQQYPPPYGNYPPQHAPRVNHGPAWDPRPAIQGPPPQSNYNYGQPHGQDYVHQNPYSHAPAQNYGPGYNEMRYDNAVPPQQPYAGPGAPQPTGYHHGGPHAGYGPQDQYARPSPYPMQQQQQQQQPPVQGQTYGQPRPNQPGENPYQTPVSATQPYGSSVPLQQSYPYASSGPMQQTYPMYGSGPTTDGYNQQASAASGGPVYPQHGGQAVAGYGQPVVAPQQPQQQQPPSGYAVGAPTTGYSAYPSQPGYADQPAANNAAYGGYQQQPLADAAAYASAQGSTAYAAPSVAQPGYAQSAPTQPIYDQSVPQSGGYGTGGAAAPAPAPAGYVKSVSPQPGFPPQYDSSQMYGAPR